MVVFGLQQAKADFMSVLNQNNLGLSGTNFGTVTVSLSGQTATITFDAAPGIFFVRRELRCCQFEHDFVYRSLCFRNSGPLR